MPRRPTSWQSKARRAAKDYTELKRRREQLKHPRTGAALDGMPGGSRGSTRRPTEALALMELPPAEQRRLEAVEHALAVLDDLKDGEDRRRLADLLYFRPYNQRKTIVGAALEIPVCESTALIWNTQFLLLVYSSLIYPPK